MFKNKSFISIGTALLLFFMVFSVFQFNAQAAEKLRIAYIRPTNEPYYKFGFDGAKMMSELMGVEILGYISDMKPEKEIASVEDAITQQVDGIVLMSVSASAMPIGIKKAYEAKIPIFLIFGYNEELIDKMVGTVQADCNLQAAEPNRRQASGLCSRSKTRYFRFSPRVLLKRKIMVPGKQILEEPQKRYIFNQLDMYRFKDARENRQ